MVLYVFLQAFSKKKVNDRKDWLNRAMEDRKWRRQQGLPEVRLFWKYSKVWDSTHLWCSCCFACFSFSEHLYFLSCKISYHHNNPWIGRTFCVKIQPKLGTPLTTPHYSYLFNIPVGLFKNSTCMVYLEILISAQHIYSLHAEQ